MRRGELACSALSPDQWPSTNWQEIAMMGRSNSGKSTLLNALLGMKTAHVSNTPGRTQRLNFFWVRDWYLVDLPGFGYARVPLTAKAAFGQAVDLYLTRRSQLTGAILIQDIRRDPEDEEIMAKEWALARNILFIVTANKVDKLNTRERRERSERLTALYGCPVYPISAQKREGLDPVKQALTGLGLTGIS